jgi:hypothetical protein
MTIVVLPRIEIDNPFGELAEILKNEAIPMIRQLAMNKEQIAILSDTELTDHIPVLKQFAPELLTQDGKIDWNKIEEYLKSDDLFKQEVANYLIDTRRRREEFRNLPIGAKLETMREYGTKTNPQILKKEFTRHFILNKYQEVINNSNLPEDVKLFLLVHAPEFAERVVKNPAYFSAFLNIIAKHSKKQDEAKQEEGGAGGWRLSLGEEGQKGFGIRLEEPQLTPPQISPPQVPEVAGQKTEVVKQKPVGRQGSSATGTGQKPSGEQKGSGTRQILQLQQASDSDIQKIYIDGVEYTVRPKKDGGYEVLSIREIPLQNPLVLDPTLWLSGLLGKAVSKVDGVIGKVKNVFGRTSKSSSQQIDFMTDTSKVLNLEKAPQPPTISEIVKQFLSPKKQPQKTQVQKSQKRQTKKRQTKKKKSNKPNK